MIFIFLDNALVMSESGDGVDREVDLSKFLYAISIILMIIFFPVVLLIKTLNTFTSRGVDYTSSPIEMGANILMDFSIEKGEVTLKKSGRVFVDGKGVEGLSAFHSKAFELLTERIAQVSKRINSRDGAELSYQITSHHTEGGDFVFQLMEESKCSS